LTTTPKSGEGSGRPVKLEESLRSSPKPLAASIEAVARTSVTVWESIPFKTGLLSHVNPSGEKQAAMDVFSNDAFCDALLRTGAVAEVASEELDVPAKGKGSLHVAMDPLDGSSNLETNNPLGSIFGFYEAPLPCSGRRLVGAAFVTYGPALTITFSTGGPVSRFAAVRDGASYAFELVDSAVRMPDRAGVFGIGGRKEDWVDGVAEFVGSLERRGAKLRYCGTFVGDYNQVLKHGGVFGYPALRSRPGGKLRVLYETAPMGYITEKAGGAASDGARPMLDLVPGSLAATAPAYFGSPSVVRELEKSLRA
jgi:fructose-1,6-bisphosphatase I